MDVDFRTQAIHAGYEPLDNGRAADGFEYSRVANPSTAIIDIEPLAERPIPAIYCTSAGHQR